MNEQKPTRLESARTLAACAEFNLDDLREALVRAVVVAAEGGTWTSYYKSEYDRGSAGSLRHDAALVSAKHLAELRTALAKIGLDWHAVRKGRG